MNENNKNDIPFINSTLRVVASEFLDISQDLQNNQHISISELFDEEKKTTKDKEDEKTSS